MSRHDRGESLIRRWGNALYVIRNVARLWTVLVPALALLALGLTWGRALPVALAIIVALALARDTVFAAVMITCNGIVGLSLLTVTLKRRTAVFNAEGTGKALATVATLST